MFYIMQHSNLESELSKLNPVSLDEMSGITLMSRIEIKYVFTTRFLK